MKSIAALQEIIFPVRCIGCSALGLDICSQCRYSWIPRIYRTWPHLNVEFPIYSSIAYSTLAGKIILAAKEDGVLQAERLIVDALSHALSVVMQEKQIDYLIPIPSRKNIARLRGRQFINELSMKLSSKFNIPTSQILEHTRRVKDQSTLDAAERNVNLHEALTARRFLPGKVCIIDDLVTTGATLREASRALRAKGIEVTAAVTACFAEPLR